MQPTASKYRRKLIVVATIDAGIENALTAKLDDTQFQLLFIRKGTQVVLELLEREVDLLILDVDIQGIIAIDLIPLIRKLRPRLPVILISEDYTLRIHKLAAEQGITYQSLKPQSAVNAGEIVYATEKILQKTGSLVVN
jgi:DNA-binding NtrC family response regulator